MIGSRPRGWCIVQLLWGHAVCDRAALVRELQAPSSKLAHSVWSHQSAPSFMLIDCLMWATSQDMDAPVPKHFDLNISFNAQNI